ncbi:carboxypeptidase-like regulatory domain-containing protein [Mucilaginibacter sp. Bleaf8]|nr:carboxypeptidase-like regulatory domain-containing protein [Mucilaginibacter sp. Bleaf8]
MRTILALILVMLYATLASAQNTIVSGTVTDASNRQPLPYVSVGFPGSSIGISTDANGRFTLRGDKPYTQVQASFVGYKAATITVKPGVEQEVTIRLAPDNRQLSDVLVRSSKKKRYTNKDNPAVELIRKVIANKEKNRPESYNFVEYRQYERMALSLMNVSATIADKKFFRKYKFLLDNRDTTTVPGKNLLPIYLNEKLSQVYYRKSPEKKKTTVLGEKGVNFGSFVDSEGIGVYFKHLYADVDIYANSAVLFTNEFLSPISDNAPNVYKFFITDTIVFNNTKLVELSFTPRNVYDMLYEGSIFITLDGNYAVQKADLTLNRKINLNWVKELNINLEFEQNPDGRFHLSRNNTLADFGISKNKKGGVFGQRTVTFKSYKVNQPRPDTTYEGELAIASEEVKHRSEKFWQENRLDTLNQAQSKVYANVDSLSRMKSFKRTIDIASLLLAGYKGFGPIELGPANTFYSFNPIEGFRLRLGGRTTPQFSKRLMFETYGAYGFKDEKWKMFFSGTYSLKDKQIYRFPQEYIRASFQRDTRIPGQELQFVREDNFLLSFKRGNNDKYLYNDFYRIDYVHEFPSHFSYTLGFRKWTQSPAGSLYFINQVNNAPNVIDNLTTTQATVQLRYAPHEEFYQGKIYRVQFYTKYPVITLNYTAGLKNVLGGENSYQNLMLNVYKHTTLKQLGFVDITAEGGNIFGSVPYPLLTIHRANQTYAYDLLSYNLMNFLEFVSDHYASINVDQHFNGYFFNRIPLFKKLKWRETLSVKALWGGIRDENNPDLHPSLYDFPKELNGDPITYALGNKPYVEGSVGIENIFKVLRVDLVRRFNYLDHPNVAEWGVRTRVSFVF